MTFDLDQNPYPIPDHSDWQDKSQSYELILPPDTLLIILNQGKHNCYISIDLQINSISIEFLCVFYNEI